MNTMDVREKASSKKRLIDANALIKEANADGAYGYVDAKQIADAPTVDAVEVVRCEKCKYKRLTRGSIEVKSYSCGCSYSPCRARIVEPHFSCFYGEEAQQ